MLLIELKDVQLLRRLLQFEDLEKWNAAIEKYIKDLYPDAPLTFSRRHQCWKVTNSDVVYFVDVELIMTKVDFGYGWSGDEAMRKLHRTNELMLSLKSENRTTRRVSFLEDRFSET